MQLSHGGIPIHHPQLVLINGKTMETQLFGVPIFWDISIFIYCLFSKLDKISWHQMAKLWDNGCGPFLLLGRLSASMNLVYLVHTAFKYVLNLLWGLRRVSQTDHMLLHQQFSQLCQLKHPNFNLILFISFWSPSCFSFILAPLRAEGAARGRSWLLWPPICWPQHLKLRSWAAEPSADSPGKGNAKRWGGPRCHQMDSIGIPTIDGLLLGDAGSYIPSITWCPFWDELLIGILDFLIRYCMLYM